MTTLQDFDYYDLIRVAKHLEDNINQHGFDISTKNKIRQIHNDMLILFTELHHLEFLYDNSISQQQFFNRLREDYDKINFLNLEM